MSAVPAAWAGAAAKRVGFDRTVNEAATELERTWMGAAGVVPVRTTICALAVHAAAREPKRPWVVPARLVPVMVTICPPAVLPEEGVMAETVVVEAAV